MFLAFIIRDWTSVICCDVDPGQESILLVLPGRTLVSFLPAPAPPCVMSLSPPPSQNGVIVIQPHTQGGNFIRLSVSPSLNLHSSVGTLPFVPGCCRAFIQTLPAPSFSSLLPFGPLAPTHEGSVRPKQTTLLKIQRIRQPRY